MKLEIDTERLIAELENATYSLNKETGILLYTMPPRTWVDLTEAQIKTIEEYALTKHIAIRMVMETLKELNA
jgi:hypothetical protein